MDRMGRIALKETDITSSERFMAEPKQCLEIWGGNQGVEEHFHRCWRTE